MSHPVGVDSLTPGKRALLARQLELRGAAFNVFPLSFAQERLWFLEQIQPGSPSYNIPTAFRLRGELRPALLAQVLGEVTRRHEALRTTFLDLDGRAVQRVSPAAPARLPTLDLGDLPPAIRERTAAELARAEARLPFDLTRGPLLRSTLLRTAAEEHILLLTLHHIVADGWSMGVLVREVSVLYAAFGAGRPSPLPELPIQVPDFAHWQRSRLGGEVLERQLAWWKERLVGLPVLELPTDRPRPAVRSLRGRRDPFPLEGDLARRLRDLGRRRGATLFMTILTAFQALLARHTGQDDVVVGSPIANRNRREVEPLIGFFVNTLVLRTELAGDPSFAGALERVRETCLEAFARQDLPFEKLVEELQPQRDPGRNPLFQVMVAVENAPLPPLQLPGLTLTPLTAHTHTSKFDLHLDVWERQDLLECVFEFAIDLFDPPTVARLAGQLRRVLEQAAADPELRLSRLDLLTAAERHQLLREWNDSGRGYPREATLAELFAEQAALQPAAPALSAVDGRLSYGELDRRANRLARRLRQQGVGAGSLVGICAERSLELIVGLLGILKAGGAYVPLDPEYPRERLALLVEDSAADILLVQDGLTACLPSGGRQVPLSATTVAGSEADDAPLPPTATAESLAYVMYTSGSTGRPKGVAVPHRAVVRLVREPGYARFGPGEVFLQLAPVSFDASTLEIWGPLLNGGRLVLMPPGRASLEDLGAALEEDGVTTLWLTSALFQQMVDAHPQGLRPVCQLLAGGDVLPVRHVRRALQELAGTTVINGYGPTENTTFTCCRPMTDPSRLGPGPVPVGRPIGHTRVRILDRQLEPVPAGVPGELHAGGDGLARGYLSRPDLTAERFVPDPSPDEPGARLYRTGDRARFLPDGEVEFLGRLDEQVKIRGFRVEPGEVEAALTDQPGVREAAVVANEEAGGKRLVAYVVLSRDEGAGLEDARRRHVSHWSELFEEAYRRGEAAVDSELDLRGWISSDTGEPIPEPEMREWVDGTVARIRAQRPRRVLEIGCGTGLLLLRVAPSCERYVGTDFSPQVIASLRRRVGRPGLEHVELLVRRADELDGFEARSFDHVVLNSVVQYFPDIDYLLRVLNGVCRLLSPGGTVLVGDVRSLPLRDAFHGAVELARAEAATTLPALRRRIALARSQDDELALDPAWFWTLRDRIPRSFRIEVHPHRGRGHNELTRFRYQTVLRFDREPAPAPGAWLDWRREGLSLAALRRLLVQSEPALLAVRGIPNARLAPVARALELIRDAAPEATAGQLRQRARESAAEGVELEDLLALAADLPYELEVGWGRHAASGDFDALLRRRGSEEAVDLPGPEPPWPPWAALASEPLQGAFARRTAPRLRRALRERLPDSMVPAAFVVVEALPMTPNGKVDRRELARRDPALEQARPVEGGQAAPRTPVEETLCEIWAEVLGLERVGRDGDFFELGGHSLLATQAISRVRSAFRVELPLQELFEHPTAAALAAIVEKARGRAGGAAPPPLRRAPREGSIPLSFAQERLWFLHQLQPDDPSYNEPILARLNGPLDAAALARAFTGMTRRHEVLRTTFPEVAGRPVQIVLPATPVPLPIVDLEGLPAARRQAEVRRLGWVSLRAPFDLGRGPLARLLLARHGGTEHELLLILHHIVFDGWSTTILMRELAALYAGSALPELRIQYADFALWQRQWLQGDALAAQLAWWRERLAGMAVLELPTDRARPGVESHRGATCPIALPAALTASLRSLGQDRRATLFMTLLAAFQTLLHRLTGQDDVVVGSPVAGRNRAEIEGLIGFFVNMLVLRADCGGDPGFLDLVERVREVTLGAYDHQDLPFEKLVAELRPGRDLSANPLFQVSFQILTLPRSEAPLPGLTLSLPRLEAGTAKFDLSLHLVESGDEVAGWLEYAVDLFEATTARRLLGCLHNVIEGVAADPSRRLSELELLSPQERHQVLAELQAPEVSGGPEESLHGFFEAWVDRAPGSPAVAWRDELVTYGELEERANRLAARLRERGAGPEARVAVCLERSPDLIAALLAVLKAGAAYIPMDPVYPAERSRFMLQDSGALLLITRRALASSLGVPEDRTVLLDDTSPRALRPEPRPGHRNLAYVIYTSGSTGRPKGVAIEHRSAAALLRWAWQAFPGDALQAVAACTSVCFDLSVFEIFVPLSMGGRVLLVDDALDLPASPAAAGATLINGVPSAVRELLRFDGLPPRAATICMAGEPLPRPLVDRLLERPTVERVLNLYGPSEDTTYSTFAVFSRRDTVDASAPAIGRPIAGTRLRLLDRYGQPTPPGVPGEIHLGGAGLARGYLNRPELTAERFVPDSFSQQPGERLYRTGDFGRLRPDGQVEFLGRRDQQVKLRGHRVELGEIEAALARHPDVEEAVVVATEGPGDPRLVAWLVPRGDPAPSSLEVRRFLRETLPEPMIPAVVAILDGLPRTPNGKVDRRALAERRARPTAGLPDAAPRDFVEEVLVGLWREILGVTACGIHDDFFELGGHSLLATQVVSRMRDAFGVEVPLRQLFATPTVAGLASAVGAALHAGAGLGVPPLVQAPPHAPGVLSFGQERLWFLHRMDPGSVAYNMPLALRLEGRLGPAVLESALSEVARRHETLRTTFPDEEGRPVPLVAPAPDLPLRQVDLASLGAAEREAEARRRAEEEARRPFDLPRGPLVRALLFRLAPEEHVLVLTLHHIVCDGWSLRLLLDETAAAYAALAAGRAPALPDLPVRFTDFSLWQRQWLRGEVLATQLAWWKRHLGGVPAPLDLPTDHPRPPVRSGRGRRLAFALSAELATGSRALGQRHGGTLFMVLLAAWATLLHRYTRREDLVVGSPIANRGRSEIEGLIGFFANTLALRVDLSGRPSFRELLARVRESAIGAYTHQDLPFEKLVEELQPERDLARTPVFQTMLVLQNAASTSAPEEVAGLRLRPFAADEGGEKFDLTLSLAEGSRLAGSLSFSSDLFEAPTMARLLGHFESLLAEAVRQPARSVAEIPLQRSAERQQILQEWSGAAGQAAMVPDLAGLLARGAAVPAADAVAEGGRRLSYRELDLQAGRIAARLRELGVGPEVRVALLLKRSTGMVAALLAVLRAGGAYVPLDPAWPAEHLAWILEDSGARVLLTTGALHERLPGFQGQVVDVAETLAGAEPAAAPWCTAPAESLAYVLYTSGSTGRPKGVMVSRGALASYLAWAEGAYPVTEGRGAPVHSPLAFDLTVTSLLLPLAAGRVVVLVPEEARLAGLAAALREGELSLVKLTPAHLEILEGLLPPGPAGAFTRSLVVGGEALSWERLPDWPGVRVFNEYGPTETVVGCCVREILPGERGEGPVPIGRPTGNARLYLLDVEMQPAPMGMPGEIWIGGLGVARGYLDRPDLTAERFLPDPWGPAGARLYRTGDLGRSLPDGEVQYLGRLDAQVKIRGFRVEPAEVEAALATHPGVRSAVVGALGNGLDRRLVAWVVPTDGAAGEPLAPALRAHLTERLPEPLVPGQIIFLDALPLTANGKVDLRALPAPDGAASSWTPRTARAPYLAPRSDLERRIAGVWQRVLRVDRVGVHDSFFELGGHSLLIAQVQAGLRAELGVDLPLVELFRFPTVARLAARVAPPPDAVPAADAREERLREGVRRIEQRARLRRRER